MTNPVFITARFRSGSTLLWNIFKQIPEACSYYEPLHEQLIEFKDANIKPQKRHFRVKRYFEEFSNIKGLENYHSPEFGLFNLLLEENDEASNMASYLRYLLISTDEEKKPVFQENRIDFRLAWIKKEFPEANIIHLYRGSRDQWISTIRDYPGNVEADLEADPYRITTWARDLSSVFPFLTTPYIRHLYQRHYYLWKLSYLAGSRLADHSISYEHIIQNPRASIGNLLKWADLESRENIDLAMQVFVQRPIGVWEQYRDDSFFRELEEECESILDKLGLNDKFGLTSIRTLIGQSPEYQKMISNPEVNRWVIKNTQREISGLWKSEGAKETIINQLKKERSRVRPDLKKLRNEIDVKNDRLTLLRESFAKKDKELAKKDGELYSKEQIIRLFSSSLRFWIGHGPLRKVPPLKWLLNLLGNTKSRFTPKLGLLYHHPPKPLEIPKTYLQNNKAKNGKDLPTISIVTPSYNQANFLQKTIKSVLRQGYPNVEYIIQDGGSNDGTLKILKQYASKLKHFESRKDKGQAHAINLGFRHSSGEIMAYLNSDDVLLPGALWYVAKFFLNNPSIDVVYGHRVIIDAKGFEVGRWVLPPHENEVLLWADFVPQESIFWRRSIWEKAGGKMVENFQFALDWNMLIRFQEAGAKFRRLPRFLAAFRVHEDQKTAVHIGKRGIEEMNLIRKKIHGREVTNDQIARGLRRYLRKSVIFHKLYRLGLLRY